MAVRYPSFGQRKQTFKRTETELNRAIREAATQPMLDLPPPEYADDLLPTLDGYVHGIVHVDPIRVQCDGCGVIAEGDPGSASVAIMGRIWFNPGSDDRRRLCGECRQIWWPDFDERRRRR